MYTKVIGMSCNTYYFDESDDDEYLNHPIDNSFDLARTPVSSVAQCKALCDARSTGYHTCNGFVYEKAEATSTAGICQMHVYQPGILYTASSTCTPSQTDDSYFNSAVITVDDNAPNWGRVLVSYCSGSGNDFAVKCQYTYSTEGGTRAATPCGYWCNYDDECTYVGAPGRFHDCVDDILDYCADTPEDTDACSSGRRLDDPEGDGTSAVIGRRLDEYV